ncbi:MarR family transcriptional regulator [Micromonospora sp. NPDC005189]|uniref:MarR family transcriptional regulator n=1 Tax=unclassified Micromonospora TaxID=2617518 RepID=UPI0033AFCB91
MLRKLTRAAALSGSATTRLVTRLEQRGLLTRILCADDRRGIYTELTPAGSELLAHARPTHDRVLTDALAEAAATPELAPLVDALHRLPTAR